MPPEHTPSATTTPAIEIDGVWKIFGDKAKIAFAEAAFKKGFAKVETK